MTLLAMPATAMAQDSPPPPPAAELNLINLPTTTSLNKHQSYFRLTHRFARDLRRGDFGSLAEDFFSLDNGAVIGLEYRFGVTSRLQAGVHRATLSKTIQFFGRYDGWRQSDSLPVSISLLGSVEGLANFHQNYQPGVGAVISRAVGTWLSVYAVPTFVAHTRAVDTLSGHEGHDHDRITTGPPSLAWGRASASGRRSSSRRSTHRACRATIPGAAHGGSPSKNRRRATRCN